MSTCLLADELENLIGAGLWTEAHSLLTSGLAAKLFLGVLADTATLRRAVNMLQPYRREIDAGLGAGTYRSGAGLYAAYYLLQQVFPESRDCQFIVATVEVSMAYNLTGQHIALHILLGGTLSFL